MTKALLILCALLGLTVAAVRYRAPGAAPAAASLLSSPEPTYPARPSITNAENRALRARLRSHARDLRAYATTRGFSTRITFLLDMQRHSGTRRFFIYDLQGDSVRASGLVAHGSCNSEWLPDAAFSNEPGCGCSSLGRYKVGAAYPGRFGLAFKLHGLDRSNSNAYARFVVLHAFDCVPDKEMYPVNICNSLGCPMVSYRFLETVKTFIRAEQKPIVLWIYN
ncbi:MAG: peptidase [Sphingobacteriales bacterium]|nr:MAG: peptidase [Sphingobacteriales bacterium]